MTDASYNSTVIRYLADSRPLPFDVCKHASAGGEFEGVDRTNPDVEDALQLMLGDARERWRKEHPRP